MQQVAQAAGVSRNAVSLALRNDPQIPPATRERIVRIAQELGYRKNPTVAHLMAELRRGAAGTHRATLALINAHEEADAFRTHPTIPSYVAGCRRRAASTGHTLDEFWLHDPAIDGRQLRQIFAARSIRGIILVGLMRGNRLPERFLPALETTPCVVTGVATRDPALSFACCDHHLLVKRAMERVHQLGYRRPALVLDREIDDLVERRFSAGFRIAQEGFPADNALKPFYTGAARDRERFTRWLRKERPDVILTLYHGVRRWVEAAGLTVPAGVGLVQMEWREDHREWAGMHQNNDIVGEAAVEMLIGMIHNGERGIPVFPRATLIGSRWMDGATVREKSDTPPMAFR